MLSDRAARWFRPRFQELSALIPVGVFCAMLFPTRIDIGFRHFLPPLVFLYILASRCVAPAREDEPQRRKEREGAQREKRKGFSSHFLRVLYDFAVKNWNHSKATFVLIVLAWVGVAGALGSTLAYAPDYLSYINFPRKAAWRDIGDSNIDWGQSLKQVRAWIEAHPTKRPIYIGYFFGDDDVKYYLGDRVIIRHRLHGIPTHGLFIISPNMVDGIFDYYDSFAALRSQTPIATIGHNMLVYDLDKMHIRQTKQSGR